MPGRTQAPETTRFTHFHDHIATMTKRKERKFNAQFFTEF